MNPGTHEVFEGTGELYIGDMVDDYDLMHELALLLDINRDWRHLADYFGVSHQNFLELQSTRRESPTNSLLQWLCVHYPDMTVDRFINALKEIGLLEVWRTLEDILKGTGELYIRDMVQNLDLMDELAFLLDVEDWRHLADYFGVPSDVSLRLTVHADTPRESPTQLLLELLTTFRPGTTVEHFRNALMDIRRMDVLRTLDNYIMRHQVSVGEPLFDLQRLEQDAEREKNGRDLLADIKEIALHKGFKVSNNPGSGNCMFHALSEQLEIVKGVKVSHEKLRKKLVQFLEENSVLSDGTELFEFVSGYSSWADYLSDMKKKRHMGRPSDTLGCSKLLCNRRSCD